MPCDVFVSVVENDRRMPDLHGYESKCRHQRVGSAV